MGIYLAFSITFHLDMAHHHIIIANQKKLNGKVKACFTIM